MVFKAHWDFYRRLKSLKAKRKENTHQLVSCIYRRNIVFDSIIKGKKKYSELNPEDFTLYRRYCRISSASIALA